MLRLIFIFSILIHSLNVYGCEGRVQKYDQFKNSPYNDIFGPYTIKQMETEAFKKQKEIFEYIKQISKDDLNNLIHEGFKISKWYELKKEYIEGDLFYSIFREHDKDISAGVILVRDDCVIRQVNNFQGSLESGNNLQDIKKPISKYFYTAFKVLAFIVCICVLFGPRYKKGVNATKKDNKRRLAEHISRRR